MGGKADPKIGNPDSGTPKVYEDAPDHHQDPDAHEFLDAAHCTPQMIELLQNNAFDGAPEGVNWTATPINATYPIVTSDDGIPEQSPAEKAWMGGIVSGTDSLYQDIIVPASATSLVLTGYYEVRTSETSTTTIYDRGSLNLTTTTGALLEAVGSYDSTHPTTAWTALNHTFTSAQAGQTVRLYFTTTNDFSNETSFFFDSLSLQAMACP
jgi:hypothetical protein